MPRRRPSKASVNLQRNIERRRGSFQRTKQRQILEKSEDYCELIYELECKGFPPRVVHLAEHFGVSHVTVIKILKRLESEGLVRRNRGKPIVLTQRGRKVAIESQNRHKLVLEFLTLLGVPRKIAEIDSEGIEHYLSNITLKKMEKFVRARGRQQKA